MPSFVHCVDRSLLQPVVCDDLVRLGSPNDGGYVVPARAIARASTMLSFGLEKNWRFEQDAAALNPRMAIHVYGRVTHHEKRVWYNDDRGSASIDAIIDATSARASSTASLGSCDVTSRSCTSTATITATSASTMKFQ